MHLDEFDFDETINNVSEFDFTGITAAKAINTSSLRSENLTISSTTEMLESRYKSCHQSAEKQRAAPRWRARDQRVTQRRKCHRKQKDVGRKGFQTTQSHFQQGRSDFIRCLTICLSAAPLRLRDDEGALVQVYTPSLVLSEQTRLS